MPSQNNNNIFYFDRSLVFLIIANLVTILIAVWQVWDLTIVIWVYWCQSAIIGIFHFVRILQIEEVKVNNLKINMRGVKAFGFFRGFFAFFFLAHYGLFHLVYFFFLLTRIPLNLSVIWPILLGVAVFFINHLYSFRHNLGEDLGRKTDVKKIMFFPYARIFPMHIIIVLGAVIGGDLRTLIAFLILKALADVVMHQKEHAPQPERNYINDQTS